MLVHTYVDNSNVFIEGQRTSAIAKGLARNIQDAHDRHVLDTSWQLDYGRLYEFVCGDRSEVGCAKLWGSPPPSDSFWDMVRRKGFEVKTYEKSFGKEKKVDVAIATQITKDAYSGKIDKSQSEIFLVAGDKDYIPTIETLKEDGFSVVVVFWDHAAREVKEAATRFISLNPFLNLVTRTT